MSSHPSAPVLTAARRLAVDRPDFTMDDLAKATRLSRATLYRLVGSRSALIQRLEEEGFTTTDDTEQLGSAMLRVVTERGIDGLTMEAVAEATGVSVATVYRRYGDRARLVAALLTRAHTEPPLFPASGDLRADLGAWAADVVAQHRANAPLLRAGLSASADGRRLRDVVRDSNCAAVSALEDWLLERTGEGLLSPGDPGARARDLYALLLAHGCLGPLLGDDEPAADAAVRAVGVFLEGVAAV
jgi:AcrR family transcriptional regulator